MKSTSLAYSEIDQFSATDKAYASHDERLLEFIKYPPTLDSFAEAIADKSGAVIDRNLLVQVLGDQYRTYTSDTSKAQELIPELANEKTFTVITAHQPVLFTGPSYVAYKIVSAVKLAGLLREKYKEHNFIPMFVTGGEDHDFEEMNHMHLYGKEIRWQNNESGAVGRMSTEGLGDSLDELRRILGDSPVAASVFSLIEQSHAHHPKYGPAFADMINGLFGHLGILVVNMDEARFKRKMIDIFKDDVLHHYSAKYVRDTQARMEAVGIRPQAFARDINLFYLDDGIRTRIEREDQQFRLVDTDRTFSAEQLCSEIERTPESFSPNVILRPLYQELIIPNLAYVGGGGELAYWFERKQQFEFYGINFPILIRRDSCLWIDKNTAKKINKLDINLTDFYSTEVVQIKRFVKENAENEFSLDREKAQIEKIYSDIVQKAGLIDPTLKGKVGAEGKKQIKSLEKLEDRLRRTEKQKFETSIYQIKSLRQKLFPGGGLQERHTNFLEFYLRNSDDYFDTLLENLNPLDMRLKVFEEDV